jgi:MFS family permease
MLLLTQVGFTTNLWQVRLVMFALGVAIAHVFVPAQAAAFATISPASTGRASTMFNTSRQVGGALGVALLTTVISAVGVSHVVKGGVAVPNLAAFHWGFATAAVIALGAVWFALQIDDRDAASTMKPRSTATVTDDDQLVPVPS